MTRNGQEGGDSIRSIRVPDQNLTVTEIWKWLMREGGDWHLVVIWE